MPGHGPADPSVLYAGTGEGFYGSSTFVQGLGIFKTVEAAGDEGAGEAPDRYQHEVAAYRLDRRLGECSQPVMLTIN